VILTDREIQSAIQTGQIVIEPRPDVAIAYSSTSVDLTLGPKAAVWKKPTSGIAMAVDPGAQGFSYAKVYKEHATELDLSSSTYDLEPQQLLLAWTKESVTLPSHSRVAARVEGKSSLARLGVCVHVTAPTIHAGFTGSIQLEMVNYGTIPVRLRPGMLICQLIFEQTLGTPIKGYSGQFAGQTADTFKG
jgi:dCTP deaminase